MTGFDRHPHLSDGWTSESRVRWDTFFNLFILAAVVAYIIFELTY